MIVTKAAHTDKPLRHRRIGDRLTQNVRIGGGAGSRGGQANPTEVNIVELNS